MWAPFSTIVSKLRNKLHVAEPYLYLFCIMVSLILPQAR
jgi:hypothetical protein